MVKEMTDDAGCWISTPSPVLVKRSNRSVLGRNREFHRTLERASGGAEELRVGMGPSPVGPSNLTLTPSIVSRIVEHS